MLEFLPPSHVVERASFVSFITLHQNFLNCPNPIDDPPLKELCYCYCILIYAMLEFLPPSHVVEGASFVLFITLHQVFLNCPNLIDNPPLKELCYWYCILRAQCWISYRPLMLLNVPRLYC